MPCGELQWLGRMHEIGGDERVVDVSWTLEQPFGYVGWFLGYGRGPNRDINVITAGRALYRTIKRSLGPQIVCNLRCKFYVRSHIRLDGGRTEEGEVEKHVLKNYTNTRAQRKDHSRRRSSRWHYRFTLPVCLVHCSTPLRRMRRTL